MNLRKLTIAQKIAGAFGVIIVLMIAVGLFNYWGIEQIVRQDGEQAMLDAARWLRTSFAVISLVVVGLVVLVAFQTHRGIAAILQGIARQMSEGSGQVAAAAAQVSSSSQHLAEGASEQAASLEETSASLEEVSSMTQRGAENAGQADQVMKNAAEVVHRAEGSMARLIESMAEISAASAETQKIVKTIDEIAFQTNLLALNAAVEAARAGEAGAGFAVVADEVRNLAMRAAEAARNTSTLIEGTVQKVQAGSGLVNETSGSFGEAAKSIGHVSSLVAEIAGSTDEQAKAISQVSVAISQIDTVTQQNAATAEESASAAEELSAQSEMMNGTVRDLMRIVGGMEEEGSVSRSAGPALKRPPSRPAAAVRAEHRSRSAALPPPAKPAARPQPGKKSSKPEDIIPMDDGDFEDF
ncbi:MAG: methyl-accepting chemotaxis protein [Desulfurivibrio sp.]